jgi:hypothetical protein
VLQKSCDEQAKADPAMMPYFFLQHDDYITLKERSTAHILSGAPGSPEGMATIEIALETLKVCGRREEGWMESGGAQAHLISCIWLRAKGACICTHAHA